jgi:hypothetical protein
MTHDDSRTTLHGSAAQPLSDEQIWGHPIHRCIDCMRFVPREGADVRDWGWCIAGGMPPRGQDYPKRAPNHVACKGGFEPRERGDESRATSDEVRP